MDFENFNQLKTQFQEDIILTESNLQGKILEIPKIYSRWLNLFTKESYKLKKLNLELDKFIGIKTKYYKEEYNRELKSTEIEKYINSDEESYNKNIEKAKQEVLCEFIEGALKKIHNLNFEIRSYIDLRKFLAGG